MKGIHKVPKGMLVTLLFTVLSLTLPACLATNVYRAESHIQGTSLDPDLKGEAFLVEKNDELYIRVLLKDAPPGNHGLHIHENGSCEDDAQAAGGHFNPDQAPHGSIIRGDFSSAHAGDLGNILVDDSGNARKVMSIPRLTVHENTYNVLGRSIVIHERADQFEQPAGNAGGRIGCGVITRDHFKAA